MNVISQNIIVVKIENKHKKLKELNSDNFLQAIYSLHQHVLILHQRSTELLAATRLFVIHAPPHHFLPAIQPLEDSSSCRDDFTAVLATKAMAWTVDCAHTTY